MNKRFHEIARQQNNINLDRSFFNANTRQDGNWKKQSTKPKQHIQGNLINLDRQIFNVNTNRNSNFTFTDSNDEINNRQFNQYQVAHNMRNRQTTFHDPRLMGTNSRIEKKILKTESNIFVKRMVNTNPYAQNVQIGVTRIQTIDTKHGDHQKYKSQGGVFNTNKFNPNISY